MDLEKGIIDLKNLKNHIIITFALVILALALPQANVYASSSEVITEDENDINPIPDKYNTGAKEPEGGFQTVGLGGTFKCTQDGKETSLTFLVSGGTTNVFNFAYGNKNMKGTYVIENTDFSAIPVRMFGEDTWNSNADKSKSQMKFVFKNCKFKTFGCGKYECKNIAYEFDNCSFENMYGSNLTVNRCYFGGGYGDRINLFTCTYINYCFFANPTNYEVVNGEIHVDGVQIYGDNSNHIDIHDIYFDHCRFEMPTCKYQNAPNVYVNACIMLQLEFSSGYNMGFTNCILNGGGYSVYAHTTNSNLTLKNVEFKNLSVGSGRNWGQIYPDQSKSINFNFDTWKETDSLYVGSVWRDSKSTSISVTNDTASSRSFRIYSSSGKSYDYTIPACPPGLQMKNYLFEDLPFDVQYSIPEKASWIVVYELVKDTNTGKTSYKKIRYENFNDSTASATSNSSNSSNNATTLVAYQTSSADGEIQITATSTPSKTKITKLSAKKKGFYVKWKKISKGIDGYQLQYSRTKNFKKKTKTITIKSNKKCKYTKKKLKAKSRYYVRIRTYKYITTNGKKQKIYSEWSKVKKVKTK